MSDSITSKHINNLQGFIQEFWPGGGESNFSSNFLVIFWSILVKSLTFSSKRTDPLMCLSLTHNIMIWGIYYGEIRSLGVRSDLWGGGGGGDLPV